MVARNTRALRWVAIALGVVLFDPAFADDLFVTTTNYEATGSCSTVALGPPHSTNNDLYTIHSDAVVRRHGHLVFIVNRYLADNVLVLDADDDYRVLNQYSTDLNSNPQDIVIAPNGRAYIPRYEETTLLVVDPVSGARFASVDLSSFADADGTPEMNHVAAVGNRVFVSIQRLDRLQPLWPPLGDSGIVVIDTSADSVVDADPLAPGIDAIVLDLQNPTGELRFAYPLQRLLAVCSGEFLVHDGGLEAVNPFTLESEGTIIDEATLGGDVIDAVIVSASLGYAIVSDQGFNTCLVRFDPSRGLKIDTPYCTSGYYLSDMELAQNGRLFVGDRTPQNPGIRVFDAASGNQLAGALSVGLPPFDLEVLDDSPHDGVTAAPVAPVQLRLSAAPNPFNPRVMIELTGMNEVRTPLSLGIYDSRGRRLRTLHPESTPGESIRFRWRGDDTDGRSVASGVYHARLDGHAARGVEMTLLR